MPGMRSKTLPPEDSRTDQSAAIDEMEMSNKSPEEQAGPAAEIVLTVNMPSTAETAALPLHPLISFTFTSQAPHPHCQKQHHHQQQPSCAIPPPTSPFTIIMSSFWADTCNSAFNRPLQTLLNSAYASCGVTVRWHWAFVRVVCVAGGW